MAGRSKLKDEWLASDMIKLKYQLLMPMIKFIVIKATGKMIALIDCTVNTLTVSSKFSDAYCAAGIISIEAAQTVMF